MKKIETKKELSRMEIIYALAQYCDPSWYHDILCWETRWLRGLLLWYEMPKNPEAGNFPRFVEAFLTAEFALRKK